MNPVLTTFIYERNAISSKLILEREGGGEFEAVCSRKSSI